MALSTFAASVAGGTPAYTAPTTSETAITGPKQLLHVKIGGTATTVTVVAPGTLVTGQANPDNAIASAATNTERMIVLSDDYRDPATGLAAISFSQVTGVTACLISL